MRRLLAVLALLALAAGGFAVQRSISQPDYDIDGIFACTRPTVVETPPFRVVEPPTATAVEPVGDLDFPTAFAPWTEPDTAVVSEREGRVVELDLLTGDETDLFDFSDRITLNAEGGVLGLAVSPDEDHLYVHYTDHDGVSHIVELAIVAGTLDPASERTLLSVEHPGLVHNGGALRFGPDDLLYIGFGDGGDFIEDAETADDLDSFNGKVLRIDPTPSADLPYTIPPDNPFLDADRPEIWASGLRNPWQFSFDPATGDFWVGDVGNNCYDEVTRLEAGTSGAYLGHPDFEADHGLLADGLEAAPDAVFPVHVYTHFEGCAVVGGAVYRGAAIPGLDGIYLFGDFCEGGVRWLDPSEPGDIRGGDLGVDARTISGFGVDADGEVYVLMVSGVHRIVAAP